MTSGAFTEAFLSVVPEFERATKPRVVTAFGASYLSTELFQRLGIADQIKGKSRRIETERVGAVVARGEAEVGFQQVSELLPIPGIDYVGPLPAEVQRVTVFSAGIAAGARAPDGAKALVRFLTSPGVAPAIIKSGLEPVVPARRSTY